MAEDSVSSLERSLQSCISLLGVDTMDRTKAQSIDNKQGVEASISRFLECARQLEEEFLKKQAYAHCHHPDETLRQEISQLKAEIKLKEDLLGKFSEKLTSWTRAIDDLQNKQRAESDLANGVINIPTNKSAYNQTPMPKTL